jgi:hypothetical protein
MIFRQEGEDNESTQITRRQSTLVVGADTEPEPGLVRRATEGTIVTNAFRMLDRFRARPVIEGIEVTGMSLSPPTEAESKASEYTAER